MQIRPWNRALAAGRPVDGPPPTVEEGCAHTHLAGQGSTPGPSTLPTVPAFPFDDHLANMNPPTVPGFGCDDPPRRDTPAPSESGSEDSDTEAIVNEIIDALGQDPNADTSVFLTAAEATELLIGNNVPNSGSAPNSDSDSEAETVLSCEESIEID